MSVDADRSAHLGFGAGAHYEVLADDVLSGRPSDRRGARRDRRCLESGPLLGWSREPVDPALDVASFSADLFSSPTPIVLSLELLEPHPGDANGPIRECREDWSIGA